MSTDNSTNKVKILDLGIPMMRAWPEDCFLSSLIQKQDTAYDWMMNSFIQICSYKQQGEDMRINFLPSGKHHYEINLFDLCPYITKYNLENEFIINNYGKFTNFAILTILKGYYLSTSLDQIYRADKRMSHLVHPAYIFGYDLEKGILHTADSYYNGQYGYMEVAIEDMDESFNQINYYSDKWYNHRTYVYKLKKMQHNFDVSLLYSLLNDYLNSHYSTSYKSYEYDNMYYGVECYSAFIKYIENIKKTKADYLDLRSFVFIHDYKVMMEKRIEYLIKKNYILQSEISLIDKIREDISQCNIILGLAIKYKIKHDFCYLDSIVERMNKLYQEECVFIEKLMAALKK